MRSKNKPSLHVVGSNQSESVNEPPHSIEAEQGILGSMLISPQEAIAECAGKISEEHFFIPAHRTIYSVLIELWTAGETIDLVVFTQILRDRNLLDAVGGAALVTSLFTFVPSAANVSYYIELVRDKYNLRHIIAACAESARRACEEPEDIPNLARYLIEQAEQIQNFARGAGKLPALGDAALLIGAKRPAAPPQVINRILHQSSKMIIGGSSKGRKTWALLDLAISVATASEWWGFGCTEGRVCYINFELQDYFVAERLEAIASSKGVKIPNDMLWIWNLRGHSTGIENLTHDLLTPLRSHKFSLCILDPIYKGLGNRDENKAEMSPAFATSSISWRCVVEPQLYSGPITPKEIRP